MKWERGRQGTDYDKLRLWQTKNTDGWLIRYPAESSIPPHRDPVPDHRHYRLNLVLWGTGQFDCPEVILNWFNRIILFRPDLHTHSMQNSSRTRLVFSIGWAISDQNDDGKPYYDDTN